MSEIRYDPRSGKFEEASYKGRRACPLFLTFILCPDVVPNHLIQSDRTDTAASRPGMELGKLRLRPLLL